ncbi:MAG: tyrosine-type recombinase/integrase [archaeon]|nr:tyrosine-type recombinase/integrase [archaeon]
MYLLEQIRNEGKRRGLSPRTIKTYCFCVNQFLFCFKKELKLLTKNDIEEYLMKMIHREKAGNTINVHLNALKFFFEKVLKRKITVNVPFVKKPKRLPEFLTKEELINLIDAIKNEKHKLMILLLYSTGMRVSELVSLKVKDFEFNENYGWVRGGKGRKDRLFILAGKLKQQLLQQIEQNKLNSEDYLFSGRKEHISVESIRMILRKATKQAGLKKKVHPHMLRHSFATHLIQNGYSVTEVQPLLGHNSLNTTMIYLHMASPTLLRIKSPLDSLDNPQKVF